MPRRRNPGRWAGLVIGLAGVVLTACAGDDGPPPPPCPVVVGVNGASYMVRHRPAGKDLTDVVFEAEIKDAALTCEYDENVIESEMRVSIEAVRGPANPERIAKFTYFVAIATQDQKILAREEFSLEVPLPGNQTRVAAIEEISPRIPLKPGQDGNDYVIYIGFALTPEELQYNLDNR